MKLAIFWITGALPVLFLLMWCITRIDYRIGSRHLKIRLFGLTLRRVSLENIRSAHKREPRGMAERWHNTFRRSHRTLTIEKSRGFWRYLSITPKNRYVFLSELRDAVRRANPACEWAQKEPEEQAGWVSTSTPPRQQVNKAQGEPGT